MEQRNDFRQEVEKWLAEIIQMEKPAESIAAFRFGLDEVQEGYVLYLAGSKSYDEADDEWAAYPPEFIVEKELIIAANEEQEWYWMLLEVIHVLGRVLRTDLTMNSFLGGSTPVYTGFVDGDLYRIK